MGELASVEICAGAGGQALGLELAGFGHEAVVEIDADACETLRRNRGAEWKIIEDDVANLDGRAFRGADLLAGGVPCPPFSIAGKQLGQDDDRDLFPQALRLVEEISPRAVLLENVRGLGARRFDGYRAQVLARLRALRYETWWDLVLASDHGVPQLRPRFVLVAIRQPWASWFHWPEPLPGRPATVGETLHDLMSSRGWPGADQWSQRASKIAPTIVGGSKKHGGPDLGPTRARAAWKELGVDGLGIAGDLPGPALPRGHLPKLTVRMVARLQGFPDSWEIAGRKTAAYRQVGNAFPPPVAKALGVAIGAALRQVRAAPAVSDVDHHASLALKPAAAKHLAGCRQLPARPGRKPVPVRFQVVIDCADPDRLARFWAGALGYELAPAPDGFASWNDFYRELGVPEEDLADGADRISDPEGHGPSIWFHAVPDAKVGKNRLHFDIHASGERTDPIETRRKRVDAEASRLATLGATITGALPSEGLDHYAVGMKDPEGNEFDIN